MEKEKNKIGILKSLGYNQVQITLAYSFYPLIPILIGIIFS
ncbi:FtsX-like permease family protein [Spiroplasma mirum]